MIKIRMERGNERAETQKETTTYECDWELNARGSERLRQRMKEAKRNRQEGGEGGGGEERERYRTNITGARHDVTVSTTDAYYGINVSALYYIT